MCAERLSVSVQMEVGTFSQSSYMYRNFESVPQNVLLIAAEYKAKRKVWDSTLQNDDFDNAFYR